MLTFPHILCPVDFSEPSTRALEYAASFTNWHRSRLAVMHVAPTFEPSLSPPVRYEESGEVVFPVSRDDVMEALRKFAKAAHAPLDHVEAVAEAGSAVPLILDRAIRWPAHLIVVGTHGRSGFDRALLGSVAERLIHNAPCPVLTVPPAAHHLPRAEVTIRHVVCAVDFSPSSLLAAGFAFDMAAQMNATATLLHVVDWPEQGEPRAHAHFAVPEYLASLMDDARERLQSVTPADNGPTTIVRQVVAGRPRAEILRYATAHDGDLIVMGAQGRDGVGLALLGSTTERIARAAACPVLTVRGTPMPPGS